MTSKHKSEAIEAPKKRGRRAADGAIGVNRYTVTMPPKDHEDFTALGGSVWLRSQIAEARASGKVRESRPSQKLRGE